jgi:hypothetical protein
MVWLVGAAFIAFGVVMLLKRDWMWRVTRMGNEMRGQVSERTDLWEMGNAIGGVVTIVVGVILILLPTPA